jgi:hypothetical protein
VISSSVARASTQHAGAFDSDAGREVAADVVEMLESELVWFRHRVAHDFGIAFDRARAALVLLSKLAAAGVPWTARPDSAPRRIFEAFIELIGRAEASWPQGLAEALHAELAEFVDVTRAVAIAQPPQRETLSALLRHAGAAPELWWWSSQFDGDPAACVAAASTTGERTVGLAIALGIPAEPVARSLAGALAVGVGRAKTARLGPRIDLVGLLNRVASSGRSALAADADAVSRLTALAFQLTAVKERDGLAELAVLAYQLIELLRPSDRPPDPERFCDIALRAQRALRPLGVQLAGVLKRDLEPALAAALASRFG